MTTAVSVAVQQTFDYLGGDTAPRNRLNGAYTAAGTTLTLEYDLDGIRAGAELEIDSEVFYVWSVSGQVATVSGAQRGTTAANHADDSVVRVAPEWFNKDILQEIQHAVRQLSGRGFFTPTSTAVTFDYSTLTYDVSAITNELSWYSIVFEWGGETYERFDFTELNETQLRPIFYPPVTDATVRYRKALVVPTATTDDLVSTCGLANSAIDIPPMLAAAKLLPQNAGSRVKIRSHQGSRMPDDVGHTDILRQSQYLQQLADMRMSEELLRLREIMKVRQRIYR